MTDHPIPDDLLRQVYIRTGHGAGGQPVVPRAHVDAVLAALAEWADGALIDPETWELVEAKRVPWEWDDYDRAVIGRGHSHDLPDSPEDMPLFRLSPREQADG